MAPVAIRASGLGKRYELGQVQPFRTLRDAIAGAAGAPWRALRGRRRAGPAAPQPLWALREVSFELEHGEVLGVIGRNGAGKSTLLRLLARITEPSEGRAELRGRVASLLEVGTGFHPELTGRENVYLNGALLGMTRAETRARFDEIADFAEVERFLDTPVKRYSTGMRMRLAFAVAAHLDPDILLVDEVLAVGDASFQRKCIGRMNEAARDGRTVLFVSHDMNAVERLCSRVILLDAGRVAEEGAPRDVIRAHLEHSRGAASALERSPGCYDLGSASRDGVEDRGEAVVLRAARVRGAAGEPVRVVASGGSLVFELDYRAGKRLRRPAVGIILSRADYGRVAFLHTLHQHGPLEELPAEGTLRCSVARLPLAPGSYTATLALAEHGKLLDWVEHCIPLEVQAGDYYGTGMPPVADFGPLLLDASWELPPGSR